ncbi:hypothetical protein M2I83_16270 [Pseudomonas aeruginosa]|uniref:zonular occludens toxin domain-containing protein n=1 Tax=Pseudomonas aeruginosa TaxID=287 RepID=UPI0024C0AE3D|nr:zonular occludens toxin domain-containing protein [Pseudomonas aeruginosa]WHV10196.1 hypothetical protein M2I83_16270 [Pseudomonas aeruginosa]
MAIDAYVGKPGHGKSYGVVEHVIIPSLKQDRHVVTNIPLEVDMLLMDFGGTIEQLPEDWFEREDLADFAPPGSVLVLDELWRRWPKGQKTNDAPMADKKLLAEHRHRVDKKNRSMRVVMVTQDLDQLASWATLLVERVPDGQEVEDHVPGRYLQRCRKGDSPPKSKLLRSTAGRFKPESIVTTSPLRSPKRALWAMNPKQTPWLVLAFLGLLGADRADCGLFVVGILGSSGSSRRRSPNKR